MFGYLGRFADLQHIYVADLLLERLDVAVIFFLPAYDMVDSWDVISHGQLEFGVGFPGNATILLDGMYQ